MHATLRTVGVRMDTRYNRCDTNGNAHVSAAVHRVERERQLKKEKIKNEWEYE